MQTASVLAFEGGADLVVVGLHPGTPGRAERDEGGGRELELGRARAKNSSSFGFAPGQPPSMKATPRWSSCSATRSLSSTVSEMPSCWEPSRKRRVEDVDGLGQHGQARSRGCMCPWWRCAPWSVDMLEPVLVRSTSPRTAAKKISWICLVIGPGLAVADRAVVDLTDGDDLGRGAGEERLVGE